MRGNKSTPSKIKEIKRRVALLVSELPKMDHHQQQGSPILPKQMEAAVSLQSNERGNAVRPRAGTLFSAASPALAYSLQSV